MMSLAINELQRGYAEGSLTPEQLVDELQQRIERSSAFNIWTRRLTRDELQAYLDKLAGCSPQDLPLYGVPFAIKDNIDLAGIPTTAGCPEFSYTPDKSSCVVEKLIDAGAIPLGKTNLDQFATGLVGTRAVEPYGVCKNAYQPDYISGGSSSGSAVALARGLVSFSLGSDTAGSGRVPAGFNNLVGVKPSKGLLSTTGLVPACRSLDCISIFALNPDDASKVLQLTAGYDPADPYSKPLTPQSVDPRASFICGVPAEDQLQFFGNSAYQRCFKQAVKDIKALGGKFREIDFAPFIECARLLYEGPWVAERYAAIESQIEKNPAAVHPVVRQIIEPAAKASAVDAFKAEYRRAALHRKAYEMLAQLDFVLTPTAGTIYPISSVEEDPVTLNSNLGYYTNFMNLLDLAALAVPAGFTEDGLPFGVTLFGKAGCDKQLLGVASRYLEHTGFEMAATGTRWQPQPTEPTEASNMISLAVCGAHLSGMPLNHQLRELGAELELSTHTADCYALYALAGGPPFRPGLVRNEANGAAIEVEVWRLPGENLGAFMQQIPSPLGIGKVELKDGRWVQSFICEPYGLEGAENITGLGSWRVYMAGR